MPVPGGDAGECFLCAGFSMGKAIPANDTCNEAGSLSYRAGEEGLNSRKAGIEGRLRVCGDRKQNEQRKRICNANGFPRRRRKQKGLSKVMWNNSLASCLRLSNGSVASFGRGHKAVFGRHSQKRRNASSRRRGGSKRKWRGIAHPLERSGKGHSQTEGRTSEARKPGDTTCGRERGGAS